MKNGKFWQWTHLKQHSYDILPNAALNAVIMLVLFFPVLV